TATFMVSGVKPWTEDDLIEVSLANHGAADSQFGPFAAGTTSYMLEENFGKFAISAAAGDVVRVAHLTRFVDSFLPGSTIDEVAVADSLNDSGGHVMANLTMAPAPRRDVDLYIRRTKIHAIEPSVFPDGKGSGFVEEAVIASPRDRSLFLYTGPQP